MTWGACHHRLSALRNLGSHNRIDSHCYGNTKNNDQIERLEEELRHDELGSENNHILVSNLLHRIVLERDNVIDGCSWFHLEHPTLPVVLRTICDVFDPRIMQQDDGNKSRKGLNCSTSAFVFVPIVQTTTDSSCCYNGPERLL
jgi:hypothetical protein